MNPLVEDFNIKVARLFLRQTEEKLDLAIEEMAEFFPMDILQDLKERVRQGDIKASLMMKSLIKVCGVRVTGGMLGWKMAIKPRSEIEQWLEQEG